MAQEADPGVGGDALAAREHLEAGDLTVQLYHAGTGDLAVRVLHHGQVPEGRVRGPDPDDVADDFQNAGVTDEGIEHLWPLKVGERSETCLARDLSR
jgi:hypothetical protein